MRALTLGQARPDISRVLGVCESSDLVPRYLNEASERLLNRETYPAGTLVRYRICAGTTGCLTWPRQVRTIEAFAVCRTPGTIRSPWFEFIGWPSGNGLMDEDSMPGTTLVDRETACAYDDVIASVALPKRIAVIAQNAVDADKTITLRFYDSNGNRVYTSQTVPPSVSPVVQEGERLTIVDPAGVFPAGATITAAHVMTGGLYAVIKDVTQYPVRLYEVNDANVITRSLAMYEPSETNPIYRRSQIPGFTDMGACDDVDADCTVNKQVTALVKLQHVPVVVDNDPVIIGNLAALKLMVMAILREEQNRHDEAAVLEAKANREIDGELSSYLGSGVQDVLKVAPGFGAGNIQTDLAWGWQNW